MNKLLLSWAAIMVAFSVFGQGTVRRVSTIAELQAIDPFSVSVGDVVSYEVAGYTSSNIWAQPRIAEWNKTSALPQDDVYVFTTATSGRWIFRDKGLGYTDVSWANAMPQLGFDNSDAFDRALAITNNLMLSVGRYEFSRPISVRNQFPLNWRSTLGSFQGGWQSSNQVTESELVYTGPATNIFVNLMVGMDGTGTNQMIRYGHVMENVSINANGLAETALAAGHLGRATLSRVRYNGATGTNLYLGQIQFLEMRSCSTSRNDERPDGTIPRVGVAIAEDGTGAGAFSAASTLIDCVFESSTEWGLVLGPNTRNITVIGGAVESNFGNGVAILAGSTGNMLQNVWFENNGGTTNLWLQNTAYFNTFMNLRMNEDYLATSHIDSGYNTFIGCNFQNLALHYNGVRNKFINSSYYSTFLDETAGGNTYFDLINGPATVRTNTFSSPFVMNGEPFALWNGTNLYARSELKYNGVYFGDGSNPADVGWSRLAANALSTTNTVVFLPQGTGDSLFSAYTPGDAQPRVKLNVNSTLSFGPGGATAPDTSIRRLSAESLLTESAFLSLRTNTGLLGFAAGLTNDAHTRVAIKNGGSIAFGNGAVTQDAFIERTNVGLIEIRTNLVVPGYLLVNGTNVLDSFVRSNQIGSFSYTNVAGLGSLAVINDAATNNTLYGRSNGVWAAVPAAPTPVTYTFSTGLTNSGATVYGNYFPGANMKAVTNGTMVTFSAVVNTNALTNSWQIAIDSTIVLTPNIVDSSEINPSAAGTNLSFALFNNSIATNKIDSTFYDFILAQAGGTPSVRVDGTSVTNIKTSSDIAFTVGSSEATPALTSTAVTPGSYSNATITVDAKGRITAASVTPQPQRSEVSVDGSYKSTLNFADNSIVTFTAAGTNVTADIQDNSITTNKIDGTFMAALNQFLGKATWVARPDTVGSEVSSLVVKGVISTVLFSQYTAGGGCVSYDEYDVQFSSDIGTAYTPVILIEGSKSGIEPTGGIVQNNDGSSSISGTGFKVWRAHGVDEPCLDDGYRITVLITNY